MLDIRPSGLLGWKNTAQVLVLLQIIYSVNAIPINILMAFFTELEKKYKNSYGAQIAIDV